MRTNGETDMTKLIVAFLNSAQAPNKNFSPYRSVSESLQAFKAFQSLYESSVWTLKSLSFDHLEYLSVSCVRARVLFHVAASF